MSWMASAVAGSAVLGYMGSKSANKANAEAAEDAGMPKWDPRQEPYLFGSTGWQPEMPEMSADAMNYMTALSGGFNPQYGPQQPMDFEQLLGGILNPQQAAGGAQPWYQDPNASPQQAGQQGGVAGLLGYGQGTPPPLYSNNPYFSGQGVMDPQNLMQGPGGYDPANAGYAPQQQQAGLLGAANGSQAMPAPSSYQTPEYMVKDYTGKPAWAREYIL